MSAPMLTAVGLVGIVFGAVFLTVALLQYLTGASFAVAGSLTIFNLIAGIKVLRASGRKV
ncbi:MAG: hypothetical protein DMF64_05275 [Acidobacteria bacterium]|nr:MAG: hypothetical protein DMF64_05275 [Acidobacteriota bacterium]